MKYLRLNSVGSAITKDLMIYPLYQNGEPDFENGVYLMDAEEDWILHLSVIDIIETLKFLRD